MMPDLKKGDIIYSVQHDMIIGYSHYGVYIGGGKVIHFASNPNDGNEKNIHITSLEKFQGDGDKICVRYIPSSKKALAIILKNRNMDAGFIASIMTDYDISGYHCYSSEETVRRAKSRLGMSQYSLMFNNCEHFAIWCKTGLKESSQMIRLLCDLF